MVSFLLAVSLDFVAMALLLSILVWRISREDVRDSSDSSVATSSTLTRRFCCFSSIFVAIIVAEIVLPDIAILTRLLVLVLIGVMLLMVKTNSKDLKLLLLIAAIFLLLQPKIAIILQYPSSKLYTDAWSHYRTISDYQKGDFGGSAYYTTFPIVYAHILFVSDITGIGVFHGATMYYLIINLLTALILYKMCEKLVGNKTMFPQGSLLPPIAVLIYSIVSYPNVSILRELPQSVGLLSVSLALYVFLKVKKTLDRKYVALSILIFLLSLSHPFAPIIIAFVFFMRRTLDSWSKVKLSHPPIYFILLPLLLELFYYSMLSLEQAAGWLWISLSRSINVLLRMSQGYSLSSGRYGEVGMDVKYPLISDRILYGVNWALPAAIGFSFSLIICFRLIKKRDWKALRTPNVFMNALGLSAILLSGFAFTFSFVEYAFSRYFGTYALFISIPAFAYIVDRTLKRSSISKIAVITLLIVVAFSTLTDYDYLPQFQIYHYNRDRRFSSPIANEAELCAARFVASNLFQNYTTIYVDRNYVHTVNFFIVYLSSSRPVLGSFNYPATLDDLLFLRINASGYILVRESFVVDQDWIPKDTVFYSNGEVFGYLNDDKGKPNLD